jgi:hypothetical protein
MDQKSIQHYQTADAARIFPNPKGVTFEQLRDDPEPKHEKPPTEVEGCPDSGWVSICFPNRAD